MLSLLFLVDGENEIGKTMAIGFTLGGMVTGFGWFAVLIWNRFYRELFCNGCLWPILLKNSDMR